MRKRYAVYAAWLIFACLLYFFENNTGSRIVLACTVLLPFAPVIRRGLFERDAASNQPEAIAQAATTFADRDEDDPGDVRAYLPGDPVNRIHWKLSAKRDDLLVRAPAMDKAADQAETRSEIEEAQPAADNPRKHFFLIGLLIILLSLILLFMIPLANQGMQALLNRLFDASEAVNAYVYDRFAVPDDQPVVLAAVLLMIVALSLLGMALLSKSRLPALMLMAGSALFQVYFGLAFPIWVNAPLFSLFFLFLLKRPGSRKTVFTALSGILIVFTAVLILYPGVDAATEAASEAVRDRLSQAARSIVGGYQELPAGENETRHVHTQSLISGDREAQPEREFHLETVEEQQISMPRWVSYLRIILLLLLSAMVIIVPFLPFALLNQRRKRAMEARKAFQSENVNEAVFSIFQHIAACLEAVGKGGGNAPYADWAADLSADYALRFAACEKLFEEAAYSTHEMKEEDRQQALALLTETEQFLQRQAGWKQRLRLKYKECLWV